ncbi:MAG: threonine synthase [Oscillospiraceae bacterium]|jgi:threonine synthase|nr:threonine synthase [Oscillospiraceae bacterium]
MRYISTRGQSPPVSGAEAILRGPAPDGGLYVPERMPVLPGDFAERLAPLDYPARAAYVLSLFLPEFGRLDGLCREAYQRFDGPPAPLGRLGDVFMLELWHGPTCAFKDMALQVLPLLVNKAKELTGETRDVYILTATSGDTGKAALEGFKDIPGTRVLVFYPEEGVSEVQKLQMVTQEGENVCICAVRGNFDDAQNGVKRVFAKDLSNDRFLLSSANSINLGRLLPQVAYYVSAYTDYLGQSPAVPNPAVCVPTGNFGNILAALYAKRMGVPFGRLVCASNKNNVLTNVIQTGVYDRKRPLAKTESPSMDILISSNFERALHLLGADVNDCMARLAADGKYTLDGDTFTALQAEFDAFWRGDEEGKACIRKVYEETGQVIDPHTAVAAAEVYDNELYRDCIVVSTAHPGKFPQAVLEALGGADLGQYLPIPQALTDAQTKPRRFSASVAPDGIEGFVLDWLL